MFVLYEKGKQRVPVKVWLDDVSQLEDECLRQALNLANLPFIYKWVALMPDAHSGYGMPIGGVIATEEVIIPNAVGVDIGCGMCFVQTNIPVELLKTVKTGQEKLIEAVIGCIMRNIPVGFEHYKKKQPCEALDRVRNEEYFRPDDIPAELMPELEAGYYQVGTLGGGNHFIEIQEDEYGMAGIMLHSGSRNFGYKICRYFNKVAKDLNERLKSSVPASYDLAYLSLDSVEGQAYIKWMKLALDFARENRLLMMKRVQDILFDHVVKYAGFKGIEICLEANCHHNYASLERHFSRNVWVHRKGAIRAGKGEMGIIPGSMGSYSYIVEGLGNPESFFSSSHGAGRACSRSKAREKYRVDEVISDLKKMGVTLGKHNKKDVAEECRMAYKDIDYVIQQELDLIKPVKRLKTVGVVKG